MVEVSALQLLTAACVHVVQLTLNSTELLLKQPYPRTSWLQIYVLFGYRVFGKNNIPTSSALILVTVIYVRSHWSLSWTSGNEKPPCGGNSAKQASKKKTVMKGQQTSSWELRTGCKPKVVISATTSIKIDGKSFQNVDGVQTNENKKSKKHTHKKKESPLNTR
jgi:hypothetical protein